MTEEKEKSSLDQLYDAYELVKQPPTSHGEITMILPTGEVIIIPEKKEE